jgi:hypothetical protein
MSIITTRLLKLLLQIPSPQPTVMKNALWIAVFPGIGQVPQ